MAPPWNQNIVDRKVEAREESPKPTGGGGHGIDADNHHNRYGHYYAFYRSNQSTMQHEVRCLTAMVVLQTIVRYLLRFGRLRR